jgi:hypothetical protein
MTNSEKVQNAPRVNAVAVPVAPTNGSAASPYTAKSRHVAATPLKIQTTFDSPNVAKNLVTAEKRANPQGSVDRMPSLTRQNSSLVQYVRYESPQVGRRSISCTPAKIQVFDVRKMESPVGEQQPILGLGARKKSDLRSSTPTKVHQSARYHDENAALGRVALRRSNSVQMSPLAPPPPVLPPPSPIPAACQSHLKDGLIPSEFVPMRRGRGSVSPRTLSATNIFGITEGPMVLPRQGLFTNSAGLRSSFTLYADENPSPAVTTGRRAVTRSASVPREINLCFGSTLEEVPKANRCSIRVPTNAGAPFKNIVACDNIAIGPVDPHIGRRVNTTIQKLQEGTPERLPMPRLSALGGCGRRHVAYQKTDIFGIAES